MMCVEEGAGVLYVCVCVRDHMMGGLVARLAQNHNVSAARRRRGVSIRSAFAPRPSCHSRLLWFR